MGKFDEIYAQLPRVFWEVCKVGLDSSGQRVYQGVVGGYEISFFPDRWEACAREILAVCPMRPGHRLVMPRGMIKCACGQCYKRFYGAKPFTRLTTEPAQNAEGAHRA